MDEQMKEWNEQLDAAARLSQKHRFRKLIHLPLRLPQSFLLRKFKIERIETVQTFMNIALEIPFPEANDIFLFGAKVHDSEIRLAKFLINCKRDIRSFIDVGAHVGYYSTLIAKRYPKSIVHAFEPSLIYSTLENNALPFTNIKPHNVAVGDSVDKVDYYEYEVGKKEYNSMILDQSRGLKYNIRKVACITLDNFVKAENMKVDLVKIDVEGGELAVLNGMEGMLDSDKPIVIFEILNNSKSDIYDNIFEVMVKYDYQAFNIDESGSLYPIDGKSDLKLSSENIVFIQKGISA